MHRENSDVLICVDNVLKNGTKFLKLKMFSYFSNQVELAVFTLCISTNKL